MLRCLWTFLLVARCFGCNTCMGSLSIYKTQRMSIEFCVVHFIISTYSTCISQLWGCITFWWWGHVVPQAVVQPGNRRAVALIHVSTVTQMEWQGRPTCLQFWLNTSSLFMCTVPLQLALEPWCIGTFCCNGHLEVLYRSRIMLSSNNTLKWMSWNSIFCTFYSPALQTPYLEAHVCMCWDTQGEKASKSFSSASQLQHKSPLSTMGCMKGSVLAVLPTRTAPSDIMKTMRRFGK